MQVRTATSLLIQICLLAHGGLAWAPFALLGVSRERGASTSTKNRQQEDDIFTPSSSSLVGKSFLVTGGTTGIGLETAKRLSIGNPEHIVVTARSNDKGRHAVQAIQSYQKEQQQRQQDVGASPKTKVSYKLLDLDNLQGVREAVASWKEDKDDFPAQLDCLINNAGTMALPQRELTVDGIERQMQSNHLGHFCLTALLADHMAPQGARIINVASTAHTMARVSGLNLDYAWTADTGYGPWRSYGQSKLANILFAAELQRRADRAGLVDWQVASLHPGVIWSDLWRSASPTGGATQTQKNGWFARVVNQVLLSRVLDTVQQGASTSVFLASGASSEALRGRYYDKCQPVELDHFARDEFAAQQLWEESEVKAGITFCLENVAASRKVAESPK